MSLLDWYISLVDSRLLMLAKAWGFVPGLPWRTKLISVRLVSDSIPGLCRCIFSKYSRKWFCITTLFNRALAFECSYISNHSPFKSKWCPLMLGSALIFLLLVVTHTHALGGLELMISPSTFLLQGEVPFELALLAKLVVGISYVY